MVPVIFIALFLMVFYLTITAWVTFVNQVQAKDYGNAFWLFFGFLLLACITTFPLAYLFKARNILIIFLLILFITALLGQQKTLPDKQVARATEIPLSKPIPKKEIKALEQKAACLWLGNSLNATPEDFWAKYEDLLVTMKGLG